MHRRPRVSATALPIIFSAVASLALLVGAALTTGAKAQSTPIYKPLGTEGSLAGSISFKGAPPPRRRIDMTQDENCAKANPGAQAESVLVNGGKLANVIVYVKGGQVFEKLSEDFRFAPPTAVVVIERQLCQFTPRVVALQTGQILRIRNYDVTTHNFHPTPRKNGEWNRTQSAGRTPMEHLFEHPEIIPVRCNLHPWESAYLGVFAHPFFAVSSVDGAFTIAGLPPGNYTLAAWHEVFGEQTTEITIQPQAVKAVTFEFSAKSASR